MAKYRKKPVVVEVTGQFFRKNKPWPEGVKITSANKFVVITIHGQETDIVDGDWIIEEIDGLHHYPCKPDIFEATYEALG